MEYMPREPDAVHPQRNVMNFDVEETEVVAAAFRESIVRRVNENGINDVTSFDIAVASWKSNTERLVMLNSPIYIENQLIEFADRTEEEAKRIIESGDIAPFDNHETIERIRLGRKAKKLVDDLKLIQQGQAESDDVEENQKQIEEHKDKEK
jgi:hypothetical protein